MGERQGEGGDSTRAHLLGSLVLFCPRGSSRLQLLWDHLHPPLSPAHVTRPEITTHPHHPSPPITPHPSPITPTPHPSSLIPHLCLHIPGNVCSDLSLSRGRNQDVTLSCQQVLVSRCGSREAHNSAIGLSGVEPPITIALTHTLTHTQRSTAQRTT